MFLKVKKEIITNENLNKKIETINYFNIEKFKKSFKNDKIFYNFNENNIIYNDKNLKIKIYIYSIKNNMNYKYIEITFYNYLDYEKTKKNILKKNNDYIKYNYYKTYI